MAVNYQKNEVIIQQALDLQLERWESGEYFNAGKFDGFSKQYMGLAPPYGPTYDPKNLPDPRTSDKCTPSQDCWPSEDTWQTFNQTIGGNLIATTPTNQVCFDDPDSQTCQDALNGYKDAWFVGDQPGASMMRLWDCGMQADCCWYG